MKKWIQDLVAPRWREWESFYRNRFQHDRVVRSTHGVNCTGGCSWNIFVKNGIVVWETQALDYPLLESSLPPYEPRGCQRGISFSWYLYSPIRVRYPLMRGALLDAFREAKREAGGDPVQAWRALQADPERRRRYQQARGKGGFRRVSWDEALELIAAANIHTIQAYGPDRIVGFSPIPAMSMLSYAAGSRFLQLLGGVNLSFYDWYSDLPNASPETWGEQTDVCESADWYNSKLIAVMGSNLNMTRTPDVHFFAEARHNGTKTVVFAPDFSQVSKYADQWVPLHAGSDGAFWCAVNHVLLNEFHHQRQVPYFLDYARRYTDLPFLVELVRDGDGYRPGRFLRANRLEKYRAAENGDWKFLCLDNDSGEPVMPRGAVGHRWESRPGRWNLEYKDGETDEPYAPRLTLLGAADGVERVAFVDFGLDRRHWREVPVCRLRGAGGETITAATAYDLLMAQFGVARGLGGDYPCGYDDRDASYTPAWQEVFTGIDAATVIQFARQWGETARATEGRCMIIIGAGINHWYHNNLMYRAGIVALLLAGCVGRNGGGLNHYVGQEKLAPADSWGALAFARDWQGAVRLQQAPLWHYIHTSQYRYDGHFDRYHFCPENDWTRGHCADLVFRAVRMGWMPFYPQFETNPLQVARQAAEAGCHDAASVADFVARRLASRELRLSIADPEHPANWPRLWYIWRGNAIMGSMKGHEYCLKHYLGTHSNAIAEELHEQPTREIRWAESAPEGKMDLVIDINFRMDSSALYSDIVLPTASWYEKPDLNSTDLHSYIHPLSAAVAPVWEAKSDWEIFGEIARATADLARRHLPEPVRDVVLAPLAHDSPDEIAQPEVRDWYRGECDPVPGRTMGKIAVVERDYTRLYDRYAALGPNLESKPIGAHGNHFEVGDVYDELRRRLPVAEVDGHLCPSIREAEDAADAVLWLSSLTNGELTVRAYRNAAEKTGLSLEPLGRGYEQVRMTYADLQAQPRRYNSSPLWSGLMHDGRAYAPFTYNYECLVPWRTLTGRQHTYLDHELYLAFGENLPTYKPSPSPEVYGDLRRSVAEGRARVLNCLTPHGKWHIHSTYMENLRMLTLSRGCEPVWLSESDAAELGIADNDWVEVHNDHGVYCARAAVSARIPRGVCIVYHVPERTTGIPKSQVRGGRRAGGHNSFTRCRLKPNLLAGGYGQFSYHFNYWGPTGVNRDTHVIVQKMEKLDW